MKYYKKLLIILVIVITLFILYRLFSQRQNIFRSLREGLDDGTSSDQSQEFNNLKNSYGENSSLSPLDYNNSMQLKQYVIKGSADSALTGKYVNVDMVEFLLERGVRFLDFSVFSFDGIPYVGYSTDSTGTNLDSRNKIPLSSVLKKIKKVTSVYTDPVFVHLRIKNNCTYDKIGILISEVLGGRLLEDTKVDGQTMISSLEGKIIIMVDVRSAPDYNKTDTSLKSIVNAETGTSSIRINPALYFENINANPITIDSQSGLTDVANVNIVYPDISVGIFEFDTNPRSTFLIGTHGCQILCPHYHVKDGYLNAYEGIFSTGMKSFIPLANRLNQE
jgi:hypothetical protein